MEKWTPVIVGLIIVLIFGTVVYLKYKLSPREEDKEEAKNFLLHLKDELYDLMITTIINFDYTKYTSLAEIEIEVTNSIIGTCKEAIKKEVAESKDLLSVLVLKCLDNDMIQNFIMKLLEEYEINDKINTKIAEVVKDRYAEAEEEDKELVNKFSDQDLYVEEELPVEELPPAEEVEVPAEELAKLNPQIDEEEEFNSEDESMEIVDDETYVDANGRLRSKSTGKYVKVEKQ